MLIILAITWNSVSFAQTKVEDVDDIISIKPAKFNHITNVAWGIKGGLNYYSIYGKEVDYIFANKATTYKSGFYMGVFLNVKTNKHFGLNHELLFNKRKAGVYLIDSGSDDYATHLNTYYIDLMPANMVFHWQGFQVYAGPYISALLSADIERKNRNGQMFKDISIYGDATNDESEFLYLQKFDFGINAGLEYFFDFGLSVGFRYTHGFTDLFQYATSYEQGDNKNTDIKIYNKGMMLSLGFTF